MLWASFQYFKYYSMVYTIVFLFSVVEKVKKTKNNHLLFWNISLLTRIFDLATYRSKIACLKNLFTSLTYVCACPNLKLVLTGCCCLSNCQNKDLVSKSNIWFSLKMTQKILTTLTIKTLSCSFVLFHQWWTCNIFKYLKLFYRDRHVSTY